MIFCLLIRILLLGGANTGETLTCRSQTGDTKTWATVGLSPEVGVQIFEDLVLVLDSLNDGLHHLGAVAAHVWFRC